MTDRNEPSSASFDAEEAAAIRAAFTSKEVAPPCPRCGATLKIGRAVAAGGTVPPVHDVSCPVCHRSTLVALGR